MREQTTALLITVGFCVAMILFWVIQSSIERDVWNKCHPSHELTLWETMWSSTRIDQCELE